MKNPKYVIYKDHYVEYSKENAFKEIETDDAWQLIKELQEMITYDDKLCIIRVYALAEDKKTAKYVRVCNIQKSYIETKCWHDIMYRENGECFYK